MRGLIEAYREFLVADVYRKTSQSIIDLVNRSQGGLRSELDALQSKYIEFRKAHPGIVVSADGKPGYNTSVERLSQLVAAIGELEIRSIKFQSEFDLVQSLAQHGGGLWCTAFAIGELGNGRDLLQSVDSRVNSDYLRTLVRERQELIAEHGPDTSKAQELTARISQLQGERQHDRSDSGHGAGEVRSGSKQSGV